MTPGKRRGIVSGGCEGFLVLVIENSGSGEPTVFVHDDEGSAEELILRRLAALGAVRSENLI